MTRLVDRQTLRLRWRRWVCQRRGHMPVLGDRVQLVKVGQPFQIGSASVLGSDQSIPVYGYDTEERRETGVVLCRRCGRRIGD